MNDLLAHFKAMQAMAERYLIPEPYVDRDGKRSDALNGEKLGIRNDLFAGDMLYMLDGPEQRKAQAAAERAEADASEWRMDIRGQVKQANAVSTALHTTNKELLAEVNDLRAALHTGDLAYAKLRGYLDRMLDEQPPVMVPMQREPGHASMPDGTHGTQYGGWQGGARRGYDQAKRWTDRP